MIRLSSANASLLMDVLEQRDIPLEERRKVLQDADPQVRQIGEALIDPNQIIENNEIRETVEAIRHWSEESRRIVEDQGISA
jgi:hypothetical protein